MLLSHLECKLHSIPKLNTEYNFRGHARISISTRDYSSGNYKFDSIPYTLQLNVFQRAQNCKHHTKNTEKENLKQRKSCMGIKKQSRPFWSWKKILKRLRENNFLHDNKITVRIQKTNKKLRKQMFCICKELISFINKGLHKLVRKKKTFRKNEHNIRNDSSQNRKYQ